MSPSLLRELAAVLLKAATEADAAMPVSVAPSDDERLDARAAAAFGVSIKQYRAAIARGALPAERAGRRLLVRRADLVRFAESRRVAPRPASVAPSGDVRGRIQTLLASGRLRSIPGGRDGGKK